MYVTFSSEILKGNDDLRNRGIDEQIILKMFLNKFDYEGLDSIELSYFTGQKACCQQGVQISGFIK
jgi:hypothetical protein